MNIIIYKHYYHELFLQNIQYIKRRYSLCEQVKYVTIDNGCFNSNRIYFYFRIPSNHKPRHEMVEVYPSSSTDPDIEDIHVENSTEYSQTVEEKDQNVKTPRIKTHLKCYSGMDLC